MVLLIFIFGVLLALGLFFIMADLLKLPRLATQRAMLSAMELTGAACGSRGSALLATQEGAPLPGLGIHYQPGDNSHRGDWVETRLSPAGASSQFVPVRPLPKTDDWFENVWKEYRQRKHL